jgi:hypothetical protein
MSDKKSFSESSYSNVDKKRKFYSGEESLEEISRENQGENNQPYSPPEKKKQTRKSSGQRRTRSTTKKAVSSQTSSYDPMILSQEQQENDVLEEPPKKESFSIKSSREAWTSEVQYVTIE